MSQESVELVRSGVDAVNRRDLATLEAIWTEDGEFRSTFAASEGRVFRGRQRFRDYFDALDEVFDDMRLELEEITDVDEDRLIVVIRTSARGKGSGVNVEQRNWTVWTLVDSKIARINSYMNSTDAFEAVRRSE